MNEFEKGEECRFGADFDESGEEREGGRGRGSVRVDNEVCHIETHKSGVLREERRPYVPPKC